MRNDRTLREIARAFQEHQEILSDAGITDKEVLPAELLEYFAGETPSGDTTTLSDVLANRWLLLHELAEIKHLKIKGYRISRTIFWDNYEDVLEAHLAATSVELKMALKYDDTQWVKARIKLVPSWLGDPDMPERFRKACETLIKHYSIDA